MNKVNTTKTASTEERERYIAEAAYYLAEHRAFEGGDPQQDWYEAEEQIIRNLEEKDEDKAR
jgi:hypothetical protein